jgi:hypothetical protein
MQLSHKIELRIIIFHYSPVIKTIFVEESEFFKIKENKRN